MIKNIWRRGVLRGSAATLALIAAAQFAAADEMTTILGCSQAGVTCGTANVDQIPGNISIIQQNGNSNTASVEQQAILGTYANATSIQQSGNYDSASVKQTGSQNAAGITQTGNNEVATVAQTGVNLGVQITQSGNGSSIGVTQFGNGVPGAPAITIKAFK